MTKYKVIVVSKGFITPDVQAVMSGDLQKVMKSAILIDIVATTLTPEAEDIDTASGIAEAQATEMIHEDRGGGPLWVSKAVAACVARPTQQGLA